MLAVVGAKKLRSLLLTGKTKFSADILGFHTNKLYTLEFDYNLRNKNKFSFIVASLSSAEVHNWEPI